MKISYFKKNVSNRLLVALMAVVIVAASFIGLGSLMFDKGSKAATVLEISDEDELDAFRANVNGGTDYIGVTVELRNDITLENAWTSMIGAAEANAFKGTFEGNGHAIIFGAVGNTAPIFGYLDNATVKNVELDSEPGCSISGSAEYASLAYKINNSLISNCINSVDINSSSLNAAGIACYINNSTIRNCINNGNITASNNGAGIGGNVSDSLIIGCLNNGIITCEWGNTAGIICSGTDTSIINCGNTGLIISSYYASGIACSIINGAIRNCFNTGNFESKDSYAGLSGIAKSDLNSNIDNCYNTGKFIVEGDYVAPADGYWGGICGSSPESIITNSYSVSDTPAVIGTGGNGNTSYSSAQMQSQAFAKLLNDNAYAYNKSKEITAPAYNSWKIIPGTNSGYPVLDLLNVPRAEVVINIQTNLLTAVRNSDYSMQIPVICEDSGDIEFTITEGALPDGLGLGNRTGVISGKPAETGSFDFVVKAENVDTGIYSEQDFNITINADATATPTPAATPPAATPTATATPPVTPPPGDNGNLWLILLIVFGVLVLIPAVATIVKHTRGKKKNSSNGDKFIH